MSLWRNTEAGAPSCCGVITVTLRDRTLAIALNVVPAEILRQWHSASRRGITQQFPQLRFPIVYHPHQGRIERC